MFRLVSETSDECSVAVNSDNVLSNVFSLSGALCGSKECLAAGNGNNTLRSNLCVLSCGSKERKGCKSVFNSFFNFFDFFNDCNFFSNCLFSNNFFNNNFFNYCFFSNNFFSNCFFSNCFFSNCFFNNRSGYEKSEESCNSFVRYFNACNESCSLYGFSSDFNAACKDAGNEVGSKIYAVGGSESYNCFNVNNGSSNFRNFCDSNNFSNFCDSSDVCFSFFRHNSGGHCSAHESRKNERESLLHYFIILLG